MTSEGRVCLGLADILGAATRKARAPNERLCRQIITDTDTWSVLVDAYHCLCTLDKCHFGHVNQSVILKLQRDGPTVLAIVR